MSDKMTTHDPANVPAHDLPYFDEIFARQQANDPTYREAFARNVHFGFWPQPTAVSPSLSAYASATEELSRQIFRMSNIANGQSVIDIGCGVGGMIAKMDAEYAQMDLVGLNIDPRQIDAARRLCATARPGNQVRFVVADAASTSEAASSFDRALAIEVIFHFPSRRKFFTEAHRILKPGGELLVTEIVFNATRLPLIVFKAIQNIPLLLRYKKSIGDLGDPVTLGNYRKLAAQTGFEIESVENWSANVLPSFECLKYLNAEGSHGRQSLYAPQLLDFAAYMVRKQAQHYLAIKLRKRG